MPPVISPHDGYAALPPSPVVAADVGGGAAPAEHWLWSCWRRQSAQPPRLAPPLREQPNPLHAASLLATISVSWFQPVLALGARRTLEPEDIWRVCPEDSCAELRARFIRAYADASAREHAWRVLPPVGWALASSFRRDIAVAAGGTLTYLGAMALQPFVAKAILDYLNDRDNVFGLTNGYALVALMTLTSFVGVTCLNYGGFVSSRIGVNMRSMVMSAVFEKALRLSCGARQRYTTSQIVTMMSVDTERIFNSVLNVLWLTLAPLSLVVTTVLIAVTYAVTPAVCGGVLVVAILYSSVKTGDHIGNAQRELLKVTQERVKVSSEALQGIRVMKFYAWEDYVAARVEKIRETEVKLYRRFHTLQVMNSTLLVLTPVLLGGVVLALYVLIRGDLSVTEVYTLIAIVNISRLMVSVFPAAVAAFAQVRISLDRLEAYMSSEEMATAMPQQIDTHSNSNSSDTQQERLPLAPRTVAAGTDEPAATEQRRPGLIAIQHASFRWMPAAPHDAVVADSTNTSGVAGSDGSVASSTTSREAIAGQCAVAVTTSPSGFRLQCVNLRVDAGSLVMIVGTVGAGKSSLLSAMLGEMILEDDGGGSVQVHGAVSYVAQEAWIRNASVKDNILFEDALDAARYDQVVEATQLEMDLCALPYGDETEIGERGINLSGGQKARAAIARAVYRAQYDVLVLDDPLSAVDSHVAHAIFDRCVMGLARSKTRVIVLNSHYDLLAHADKVVVMQDGRVAGHGAYGDVLAQFPELLTVPPPTPGPRATDHDEDSDELDDEAAEHAQPADERSDELSSADRVKSMKTITSDTTTGADAVGTGDDPNCCSEKSDGGDTSKLIQAEDRVKGKVSGATYKAYFDETGFNGVTVIAVIFLVYVGSQAVRTLVDWWQGYWAKNMDRDHDIDSGHSMLWFGMWYLGFIVACSATTLGRGMVLLESCMRSSKNLHDELFRRVLSAPVNTYFDVTPVGRILNRFSGDLDQMDSTLPQQYWSLFVALSTFLGSLVVCALASFWVGLSYVPIIAIFVATGLYFNKSSREVKRLDVISRTPVFNLFNETLNGLSTIRAFRMQHKFVQLNDAAVDNNASYYLAFWSAGRWLAIRMDWLSVVIIFVISLYLVATKGQVDPVIAGISLTYSLMLTSVVQQSVRSADRTDTAMTAVERLLHFRNIPAEEDSASSVAIDATLWPSQGAITFDNLCLKYRPELPLVLRGVSMEISGGEKVGICGRTGAGKSSLMVALFRICVFDSGTIAIDGLDIQSVRLRDLRRALAIIPQDPVLFSGSLRENLDPFRKCTDAAIWTALEQSHLAASVRQWGGAGLDFVVTESGENLSVGQRQLLCIARALLKGNRIAVLDEATASVDTATDSLIQDTIKAMFASKTVLIIAHRIHTILHCDKIAVMDAGRVAEFGSPSELLAMPDSIFASLASRSA